jgi:HSP20 family protein
MAEPQAPTEPARAKGNANMDRGPAEPRSFGEDRARSPAETRSPAEIAADAAQPMLEGSRQLAEQGRRATRQVADSWRQAVDPLLTMQYEIGQWMDEAFRQTFGFRGPANPMRPFGQFNPISLLGLPPADMKETGRAYLLAIELPGLAREDVDLSIHGDRLVVCGHKAEETDDATAAYRVSERRYGRFERAFPAGGGHRPRPHRGAVPRWPAENHPSEEPGGGRAARQDRDQVLSAMAS